MIQIIRVCLVVDLNRAMVDGDHGFNLSKLIEKPEKVLHSAASRFDVELVNKITSNQTKFKEHLY